jgi:hypothetical protein
MPQLFECVFSNSIATNWGATMFEKLERLTSEIDALASAAQASGDSRLYDNVHRFITAVGEEVGKAFSDVHSVLGEIAYLKTSELNEDNIRSLQEKLADTYARDKFKNVHKICDRLGILAERFRNDIEPRLMRAGVPSSSQLFWLLHKHEGAFIYIIKNAVDEINAILDEYRPGGDIQAARMRARLGQDELRKCLDSVRNSEHRLVAALPDGSSRLLGVDRIADEILRQSPWFSGAFYLVCTLLLLTALTIVAGSVNPWLFPIIVTGAFAGMVLIGALQLKNDGRLSEAKFMQLVDLALRRVLLPVTRSGSKPEA